MVQTDESKVKWLLAELPKLQKNGVLDEDEAERLRCYYEPGAGTAAAPLRSYFLLALAVIGLLLVSGGVILVFSDAWYLLPRSARLTAAFAPLAAAACCGFYTIKYDKEPCWREASALFTATGFAVLLAVVSNVFSLSGSFAEYMEYVLCCSLPLVYLFDSQALAAVCCFSLFSLLGDGVSLFARLACLAGILPYVALRCFDLRGRVHSEWMRWISLVAAAFFTVASGRFFVLHLTMTSFALLQTGLIVWDRDEHRANPWLAAGWLFAAALVTAGGVSSSFWNCAGTGGASASARFLTACGGVWLLPFAACAVLSYIRRTGFSLFLSIFPVLIAAAQFSLLPQTFLYRGAVLYAFALGLLLLAGGFHRRRLVLINAGAIQIILLYFGKFVTADLGLITLGLVFIITGALFIAVNLYLSRRFKAEAKQEGAENVS